MYPACPASNGNRVAALSQCLAFPRVSDTVFQPAAPPDAAALPILISRRKLLLEKRVRERLLELEAKNRELERVNRLFVGRELRMRELKERIKELERKVRVP